jgi:glutathione S-transferase
MAKKAARAKVKAMPLKKAAPKVQAKKPVVKKTAAKAPASRGPTPAEKQRFTLYGFATSGPTYTAALMLSLSKHPFSYIHVNLREGAHKQADYLVKNRFAQVPALRDGQLMCVQSAAILIHLSEVLGKFEGKSPVEKQRVTEWLFWAWDKLAIPIFRLRARARGTRQFADETRIMYDTEARAAISVLEQELTKNEWIGAKKTSIADIAIYGVLRYASEGGVDVLNYPHVSSWKKRFEELPGFATPEQLLPMESRLT